MTYAGRWPNAVVSSTSEPKCVGLKLNPWQDFPVQKCCGQVV